jgi:hypothetical protein
VSRFTGSTHDIMLQQEWKQRKYTAAVHMLHSKLMPPRTEKRAMPRLNAWQLSHELRVCCDSRTQVTIIPCDSQYILKKGLTSRRWAQFMRR